MITCFECNNESITAGILTVGPKGDGKPCCPLCGSIKIKTFADMKAEFNEISSALRIAQRKLISSEKERQKTESELVKAQGKLRTLEILKQLEELTERSFCALHGVFPDGGEPCWACVENVLGIQQEKPKLIVSAADHNPSPGEE